MRQGSGPYLRDRGAHPLAGVTVLQIVPDLDTGGAERTTIDVAAALAAVGARALVASEGGRLVSELQAKGGIWLPFPARTKNPLLMALNVRRLAHLIRAERADIIHARSRAPAWVAYGATRLTKTPFVTTYHGAYAGHSALKLRYNSVMARADAVIANSFYTADLIGRLYPGGTAKVRVIHRGVDLRVFAPNDVSVRRVQALRQLWSVAADERIVLLAARLTAWKGHKVLIEAARLLVEAGLTDTKFILAGDEQGRTAYAKQLDVAIAKANLQGFVRRVGHCADMPAALIAAAAVVVPSIEPEAFGRVAVEAQAMGTPIAATELGAMIETVLAPPDVDASQRTGWRVPPNDAGALAGALHEILGLGASARDALAQRARAHVTERFSSEQMCSETLDVYAALLEETAEPK